MLISGDVNKIHGESVNMSVGGFWESFEVSRLTATVEDGACHIAVHLKTGQIIHATYLAADMAIEWKGEPNMLLSQEYVGISDLLRQMNITKAKKLVIPTKSEKFSEVPAMPATASTVDSDAGGPEGLQI